MQANKMRLHYAFVLRLWLTAAAVVMLSACDKMSGDADVPIDYHDYFDATFTRGADGNYEYEGALSMTKEEFDAEVAGNGWKHVITNEINEKGKIKLTDFYSDKIGLSASHIYIATDGELTKFVNQEAIGLYGHTNCQYSYNDNKIETETGYIEILSIEEEGSMLYVVEKLGSGYSKDGYSDIYGLSIYKKMTDEELAAYRATYCQEIGQ